MSDGIITVENLGKKYRIRHEAERQRYVALRDVIAQKCAAPFRFLRNGSRPRPASPATEDFWALRDVSFEVKRGEVVGIIGRNGAGKSTLLKILSRITEATAGRVVIRGRIASLLEVGTGFHPELTGRENIFLNGAILGMSKAEIKRKFDEIVAFAEIEKFLDTPVKRYSSGMYVRLAFGVAAHLEPEILIVDEVLAVGDLEFQKKCLGKMREVSQGGRTVLFVSHQLGALRQLCHSGILLTHGHSQCFGSISDALEQYLAVRPANGEAASGHWKYIHSVWLGEPGSAQPHVFFGDPLAITARLQNMPDSPAGFTVGITDSFGKMMCKFATNPNDGVVLPRQDKFEVVFQMDFCSLAPGEYFVEVAVTEPGIRNVELAHNVLRFEVHPLPLGGSLPYESDFGEFFPPHRWRING
jgi:lipopolysaccharide transport system ATP-binding protein